MINTVSEQMCLFLFEIKPIVHCSVLLCIIHFYHISYIKAKYIQAVVILMILIILWFTHCILRNTIVLVFVLQKFSYLKIYFSIMMLLSFYRSMCRMNLCMKRKVNTSLTNQFCNLHYSSDIISLLRHYLFRGLLD